MKKTIKVFVLRDKKNGSLGETFTEFEADAPLIVACRTAEHAEEHDVYAGPNEPYSDVVEATLTYDDGTEP